METSQAGSAVSIEDTEDYIESLGTYKNLTPSITKQEATDDEVQHELEHIAIDAAYTENITDRAIETGDLVTVSYVQTDNENAQEATQNIIVGTNEFPEFEEAVLGKIIGDTTDCTITSADTTHTYALTVQAIKQYKEPDDEFAKSLGLDGVTDLNSLKDLVKKNINTEYEEIYKENLKKDLLSQIFQNTTFKDIPDEIKTREASALRAQVEIMASQYAAQYGEEVTLEDLISPTMELEGFTGTVDEYIESAALKRYKQTIILKEIFVKENLEISEDELYSAAALAWAAEQDAHPTLLDFLNEHSLDDYKTALINTKATDFVIENVATEEK